MAEGQGLPDIILDAAQRLIGKPLQPEYPRQSSARGNFLVELESDDMGPPRGRDVAGKRAIDVPPGTALLAEEVKRHGKQSVPYRRVGRIRASRREIVK